MSLMGPNGAGKPTLGYALMGSPRYQLTNGQIWFKGQDITEESTDKREGWSVLSFQNPLEVPGITLGNFFEKCVGTAHRTENPSVGVPQRIKKAMDVLQMDHSYADRDLNVGFSGGEKKKAEILQLLMLKPIWRFWMKPDSGLDVDAVRTVSKGIEEFQKNQQGSLVITHSTRILESLACGCDACAGRRKDDSVRR